MKIKSGFVIREIAGQYMAVPVGERVNDLHGMIALNETGAFIWKLLENEKTEEDLARALTEEYEVSYEEALEAVREFRELMEKEQVLEGQDG
jgi:hypothetical protein